MKYVSTSILPPGKSDLVLCDDSLALSAARVHSNAPFSLDGKSNTPGEWLEISPKQGKLTAENPGERPIRIRIEFEASEVAEKTVTLDDELRGDAGGREQKQKPGRTKEKRERVENHKPAPVVSSPAE